MGYGTTASACRALLVRDFSLVWRRRGDALNPVLFAVMVVALFPFALGPEPTALARIAAGTVLVALLLAGLLSLDALFRSDLEDGSLEQLVLSPHPLPLLLACKITVHWLTTALPLLLVAPLLGELLFLPRPVFPVLMAALALSTPLLSLIGAVCVALTVGMRRSGMLLALLVSSSAVPGQTPAERDFKATLLGTGIPVPQPERSGPATLVEAGRHKLLFDGGRGATTRLYQLKVPLRDVGPLFITHLHSDHVVGIPDLWLSGWLGGPWARRVTPFRVIGPSGTKDLMANLERAYAADIRIRMADEKYPAEGIRVIADEFSADGVVFDNDGVRVTAFEVNHGDLIKPAYGYRIDYDGRSVVMASPVVGGGGVAPITWKQVWVTPAPPGWG